MLRERFVMPRLSEMESETEIVTPKNEVIMAKKAKKSFNNRNDVMLKLFCMILLSALSCPDSIAEIDKRLLGPLKGMSITMRKIHVMYKVKGMILPNNMAVLI